MWSECSSKSLARPGTRVSFERKISTMAENGLKRDGDVQQTHQQQQNGVPDGVLAQQSQRQPVFPAWSAAVWSREYLRGGGRKTEKT